MDTETEQELFRIFGCIDELRGRMVQLEHKQQAEYETLNNRIKSLYGVAGDHDGRLQLLEME